ncbi:NADP-dependent oxidoreductase domain-containing protein [Rhexocercosporidium sp. MPI-PUGE-AT-0058]|nr:NADP-dependent oxidoreductase domain-containing protein [Rhexocercosporidium sp. MPI-PUGE-AT-0058]
MPPTLIFGAGGIGSGKISHTWTNAEQTCSLLITLESLNLTELDFGAGYPPGAPWVTDRLLGETKAAERGFVNILYAHAPDPATTAEETARAFDKQFRARKFKKLGRSNYSTTQMAEYLAVCDAKGYIKPSYYQGHYNILARLLIEC